MPMTVCPVCDNAQEAGLECELCGHPLAPLTDALFDAVPLEGLEPNQASKVELGELPSFPDLEPTQHVVGEVEAVAGMGDFESTCASPVEALVEPLSDMERVGDSIPVDEPTPYPAVLTCRYCRAEAGFGDRICRECGMRLPQVELLSDPPAREGGPQLCSCGAPVRAERCPACGARNEVLAG